MASAETSFSLMLRKLSQPPPAPSSINTALSPACDAILLRALAREPERRFRTCVELVDALAHALANPWAPPPMVTASPPPAPLIPMGPPPSIVVPGAPPARKVRRPWWVVAGVGLALLLCLVASVVLASRIRPIRNSPGFSSSGQTTATVPRAATRTVGRVGGGQQSAGITDMATTNDPPNGNRPNRRMTEFSLGDDVYITYTASQPEDGQVVNLRILDGKGDVAYFDENTLDGVPNYNGYFIFAPTVAGSYRAELYFNGSSSPSRTVSFTVR